MLEFAFNRPPGPEKGANLLVGQPNIQPLGCGRGKKGQRTVDLGAIARENVDLTGVGVRPNPPTSGQMTPTRVPTYEGVVCFVLTLLRR